MSLLVADGGADRKISEDEKQAHLQALLDSFGSVPKKVLLLPPDHTRLYSDAGSITAWCYGRLRQAGVHVDIMPTLGTHFAMSEDQLRMMFGPDIPLEAFLVHDWRNDVVSVGAISADFVKEVSDGNVDYSMQVMINRVVLEGGYDQILSIGQVVPHEVVGMANYTKNILVGVGGADMINKSHFLGAVCNMEKALGRADTPVRRVFNKGFDDYLRHLPIHFVLTVVAKVEDDYLLRGLYIGHDVEVFEEAVKLSQQVNLDLVKKPFKKAVVYLTPKEFASTWLGNKSIYRTRMAMADEGELIVLAPALHEFGEDPQISKLIRKYGYHGTPATLKAVDENEDLRENLGAAAHLIHGSSEGRFRITYCTNPAKMPQKDIESVGYDWADYEEMARIYNPDVLKDGWQVVDGEEIYYISNPALGLWAREDDFAPV